MAQERVYERYKQKIMSEDRLGLWEVSEPKWCSVFLEEWIG